MVEFRVGAVALVLKEGRSVRQAADDLALISARRDAYEPLYFAAQPNDRTPSLIAHKNAARDEADRVSRLYTQIIKTQPDVPDQLKFNAGVRLDKQTRSRTGRPRTFPRVHVDQSGPPTTPCQVKIRFHDAALARSRMPREDGITHMILHAKIAANGKLTKKASSLRVVAHMTRNPHTVKFDRALLERFGLLEHEADVRHLGVMLCGQWLNAKGEVGPLGPAAMFNVPVPYLNAQATAEPEAETHDQQSLKRAA